MSNALREWLDHCGGDTVPKGNVIATDIATQYMFHYIKAKRNGMLDQFLAFMETDQAQQCMLWTSFPDSFLCCAPKKGV
jgi:hypothetical protein